MITITKLATGSTDFVGLIIGAARLVFGTPTESLSVVLTIYGIGLTTANVVVHLGAYIAEHTLVKSNLKKSNKLFSTRYLHEMSKK
ncbi:unnamed protein product [Rotaria magnacalcarata]|nr:unnamed protein product [Rotaria magnacalcarata]CAF4018575.1 unnamed protein product [Rotaria magnacalcarata]